MSRLAVVGGGLVALGLLAAGLGLGGAARLDVDGLAERRQAAERAGAEARVLVAELHRLGGRELGSLDALAATRQRLVVAVAEAGREDAAAAELAAALSRHRAAVDVAVERAARLGLAVDAARRDANARPRDEALSWTVLAGGTGAESALAAVEASPGADPTLKAVAEARVALALALDAVAAAGLGPALEQLVGARRRAEASLRAELARRRGLGLGGLGALLLGGLLAGLGLRRQAWALGRARDALTEQFRARTQELDASALALRLSEARKAAVFESALDAVLVFSGDGRITELNAAAERLLAQDRGAVVGRAVTRFLRLGELDGVGGLEALLEDTGDATRVELAVDVRGRHFPAELAISRVRAGTSTEFTVSIRDITERTEVDRMKSEFVSTVSHELRTPLTAIKGSLGLIEGGATGPVPEPVQKLVVMARSNTDRLIRLVNDILDLEKIEARRIELRLETLDPASCVEATLAPLAAMASGAGVRLERRLSATAVVRVDRDRLVQVLTNLVSNAVKFSDRDGVVEVRLEPTADGRVRFAVRDEGPGIAPADQARLFQRFSQVDASDARAKGGTGLGLVISKAIVEQHGGVIGVRSARGEGATFWVELPAADAAAEGDEA